MSENETDSDGLSFISENPILFKKYKVLQKLCEGAFGSIYLGNYVAKNSYVAIKVEPRNIPNQHLETEAYFLYSLKGIGIPEVLSFGKTKYYNILVEPFLGKSLYHLYMDYNNHFEIKDICLIGIQAIDRLEWTHSKNIIHRDIKPDNFLIGDKNPNILYLIDFGLSTKYRSSSTGKHIKFGITGKLTGTTKYSSANTIRGGEQSRKDDLESVAYMIIYFMKGDLPWQDIKSNNEINKYFQIYLMKKNTPVEELCSGLPEEIYKFLKYVKELDFEQKPDYEYLRSLFKEILYKNNYIYNDKLTFSWVTENIELNKNPINLNKRKSNFHNRLLKYIERNLELKVNNNSSINRNNLKNKKNNNNYLVNNSINIINDNSKDNNEYNIVKSLKHNNKFSGKNSLDNYHNFSLINEKKKMEKIYENYRSESHNNYEINNNDICINFNKKNPIIKLNNKKKNINRNLSDYYNKKNKYVYIQENEEIMNRYMVYDNNLLNKENENLKHSENLYNTNLDSQKTNYNLINNIKYNNTDTRQNKRNNMNKYFRLNNINNINNGQDYANSNLNMKISKEFKLFNTIDNKTNRNKIKKLPKPPFKKIEKKRAQLSYKNPKIEDINQIKGNEINQANNIKYITKIENNNYNYFSIIPAKNNNIEKKINNSHINNSTGRKDLKFNNSFYVKTIKGFNFKEIPKK